MQPRISHHQHISLLLNPRPPLPYITHPPLQVKLCYLVCVLRKLISLHCTPNGDDDSSGAKGNSNNNSSKNSTNNNKSKMSKHGSKSSVGKGMSADVQAIIDDHLHTHRTHPHKQPKQTKHTDTESDTPSSNDLPFSIIIFAATCQRCQETVEVLKELNISCVGLHAMLPQQQRMNSLAQFKSHVARILVRGLLLCIATT
jgi:hypothetical protein